MEAITAAREKHTTLALGSKFGKYKPEAEREVRKVDVKEDEVLKQLKAAFVDFYHGSSQNILPPPVLPLLPRSIGHAELLIKDVNYSAADVGRFSVALDEFQDMKDFGEVAGQFLSVLINTRREEQFIIYLGHLSVPISHLGYRNVGNIIVKDGYHAEIGEEMLGGAIIVEGGADIVGESMKGGCIEVNGGCGRVGQAMSGGSILINGNAWHVGRSMKRGTIVIEGSTSETGAYMEGGRIKVRGRAVIGGKRGYGRSPPSFKDGGIYLEGDFEFADFFYSTNASIYHKGRLIAEKGKRLPQMELLIVDK